MTIAGAAKAAGKGYLVVCGLWIGACLLMAAPKGAASALAAIRRR